MSAPRPQLWDLGPILSWLVVELADGGAVELGVAALRELAIQLERLSQHRRRRLETAGPFGHHFEVLQKLPDVAARREVALDHPRPVGLHQVAVRVAAGKAVGNARGVDAGLLAKRYRLGEHGVADADHQLIDHFCRKSGADRPYPGAAAGDVAH